MSLHEPHDDVGPSEFAQGYWAGYTEGYDDGSADVWNSLHEPDDEDDAEPPMTATDVHRAMNEGP